MNIFKSFDILLSTENKSDYAFTSVYENPSFTTYWSAQILIINYFFQYLIINKMLIYLHFKFQ